MNEIEPARTGYTKLFHPRGALVSLPVIGETPAAMFSYVSALMDAGFVVSAPGLEAGEEKELVTGVLRGILENDGEETPTLLLYAADQSMQFSFLRVYLDTGDDIKAFEAACGVKLNDIPVYEAKDKPARDGGKVSTKYIVKLPRPVPVIMKPNPKYSEEEAATARAASKPYTKAKRIFVRWADGPAPAAPAAAPTDATPPLSDFEVAVAAWKMRLEGVQVLDDLNKLLPMIKAIAVEDIRKRAWTMCLEFAGTKKWAFDKDGTKIFRHAAEIGAPPPPTVPPVAAPQTNGASPVIVEWQKKLNPDSVGLVQLNGEILTAFKQLPKADPKTRDAVWIMMLEFAKKWGNRWDGAAMKFVAAPTAP